MKTVVIVWTSCISLKNNKDEFKHSNKPESGWQVYRHVLVSFLETAVFTHIMQVVTTNDDGALHLQLLNNPIQDATTNAYAAGEGAFFVDVSTIDCLFKLTTNINHIAIGRLNNKHTHQNTYFFWSFESQTNLTVVSRAKLSLSRNIFAPHNWDCELFLESTFRLSRRKFEIVMIFI